MPSTKNATLATVAGAVARADAESVTVELPVRLALEAGAVIETDRPAAATVALTAVELTTALLESVTRAVSETAPVAVGVQLNVKGAVVELPRSVEPERKSTRVIVAADPGVALALRVVAVLTVRTELGIGVVNDTVGRELPTVTETADDVAVTAAESSTCAVRAKTPAAAGVHATV